MAECRALNWRLGYSKVTCLDVQIAGCELVLRAEDVSVADLKDE